jgi:hypothetical protein
VHEIGVYFLYFGPSFHPATYLPPPGSAGAAATVDDYLLPRPQAFSSSIAYTTEPSLKIGRYIATTRPPISTPRITMISGSIRLESDSTAWSTSSS